MRLHPALRSGHSEIVSNLIAGDETILVILMNSSYLASLWKDESVFTERTNAMEGGTQTMCSSSSRVKRLWTITALTLFAAFALSVSPAEAWPWRKVWKTFEPRNKTGRTCNGIVAGGITLTKCSECWRGSDPGFPNCWGVSLYIGKFGIGHLLGYYSGTKNTVSGQKRKIGVKCRFCAAIAGGGLWMQSWVPRGWFATIGIRCTSPVQLVLHDSIPGPVEVANLQYAVVPEVIPVEDLSYDLEELPWILADMPKFVLSPGDSIEVVGPPEESEIADSVLVLRGMLVYQAACDDSTYIDTVPFAAEIFEETEPIPTLSEWGLIIFCVLLLGWMAWVVLRRQRRPAVRM